MGFLVLLENTSKFFSLRMLPPLAIKPFAKGAIAVRPNDRGIRRVPVLNCGEQAAPPSHMPSNRGPKKVGHNGCLESRSHSVTRGITKKH